MRIITPCDHRHGPKLSSLHLSQTSTRRPCFTWEGSQYICCFCSYQVLYHVYLHESVWYKLWKPRPSSYSTSVSDSIWLKNQRSRANVRHLWPYILLSMFFQYSMTRITKSASLLYCYCIPLLLFLHQPVALVILNDFIEHSPLIQTIMWYKTIITTVQYSTYHYCRLAFLVETTFFLGLAELERL